MHMQGIFFLNRKASKVWNRSMTSQFPYLCHRSYRWKWKKSLLQMGPVSLTWSLFPFFTQLQINLWEHSLALLYAAQKLVSEIWYLVSNGEKQVWKTMKEGRWGGDQKRNIWMLCSSWPQSGSAAGGSFYFYTPPPLPKIIHLTADESFMYKNHISLVCTLHTCSLSPQLVVDKSTFT